MALPTSTIGGLISGMDTNSIIEQLMAIERVSVKRLENKKSELDLQLEAYQSVNNLLLEFANKSSTLSESATWNTKSASSSNENALSVTSTDSAVDGSHQFKVARLASNAKFMSGGFSSMDDPVLPMGIGTEQIETEYDLDTQIADFNGGNGVDMGWITLNQGANSVNIDLSGCDTMLDVVAELTGQASNAGIKISVNIYNESNQDLAEDVGMPMGLSITCDNPDDGAIVFSNYDGSTGNPASTCAEDLGLTTLTAMDNSGLSGVFEGDDLYKWDLPNPTTDKAVSGTITLENALGRCVRDTEVKSLNGGLGIYHGSIRVSNSDGDVTEIDLSTCETLKDITTTINDTYGAGIEAYVDGDGLRIIDKAGGTETMHISNVGSGTTATDLGLTDLTYDAASDEYIGTNINQLNDRTSLKMLRDGLGINDGECGDVIIRKDGVEYIADLGDAQTLGDVIYALKNAKSDAGNKIHNLNVSLDDNGIKMEATDGTTFSVRSDTGADSSNTTAIDLGIDTDTNDVSSFTGYKLTGDLNSVQIERLMGTKSFTRDTSLKEYANINAGEKITITDKVGRSVTFTAEEDSTVGDMLDAINNPNDTCQVQLFMEPETNSFTLADTSNLFAWVDENTLIDDLKNGEFFDDSWQIGCSDSEGNETSFDFQGVTTLGDMIDTFNQKCQDAGVLLEASINSAGTGIDIEDTGNGDEPVKIGEIGSDAHAAELFGIAGEGLGGINGTLPRPDSAAVGVVGDLTVAGLIGAKIGFAAGNNVASGETTGLKGTQFIFDGINGCAGMKGIMPDGTKYNTLDGFTASVNGTDYAIDLSGISSDDSMTDLIKELNSQMSSQGLDINFSLNNAQNGLEIENNSGYDLTFSNLAGSRTATDLGFTSKTFESGESVNAGDLDTQWISRSTTLESLTGDAAFYAGKISITNTTGQMSEISFSGAETIGDVIDAINNDGVGITAGINSSGDGIIIFDDANGEGKLSIREVNGGTTAEKLGLLGSGDYEVDGSFERSITVDPDDDLRDVMNNIANSGIDVQCSIINDGSDFAPYRLSITSSNSGKESDLLLDTDIAAFNFNKTSSGKDAVLLYGQGNSGVSPVMITSPTNDNNSAVLGLDISMKQTTEDWVTVNVSQEKSQISDSIKELVEAYNAIIDLVDEFDDWDEETGSPGVFFADSNIRSLINGISDSFFTISEGEEGDLTMWYDIGVKFNDDGKLEVDSSTLNDMISNKYDAVKNLMCKTMDVARSDLAATVSTTDKGATDPKNAINGDNNQDDYGEGNGFESRNAMDEENGYQYTINFDKTRTLEYLNIYHVDTEEMPAADYALKKFMVEYLDASSNKWVELRNISNNTQSLNTIGFADPTAVKAVRITGYESNSDDNKFRLTEVEAMESQGLSAQQSNITDSLTDGINGWFASIQETINNKTTDIDDQLDSLNDRMEEKELNLINKYANMEQNLANITAQGNYFSSQAASWSK